MILSAAAVANTSGTLVEGVVIARIVVLVAPVVVIVPAVGIIVVAVVLITGVYLARCRYVSAAELACP